MNRASKLRLLQSVSMLIGLGMTRQALAVSILEDMESKQPSKFQADIIKNPQKQKLIAEIADCVAQPPFPHPLKLKCLSGDG